MINIKKIKPMFNGIITTMDKYDDDTKVNGVIVKASGALMEFQKVIAVGAAVKCMKEGDLVCIDPKRYAVMKHQDGSMRDGVITDNPIVGYCKLKTGIQLLFWSGQTFDEEALKPVGKYKAAEVRYTDMEEINREKLSIWLAKAVEIQWDYKNIVKRKGELLRLK